MGDGKVMAQDTNRFGTKRQLLHDHALFMKLAAEKEEKGEVWGQRELAYQYYVYANLMNWIWETYADRDGLTPFAMLVKEAAGSGLDRIDDVAYHVVNLALRKQHYVLIWLVSGLDAHTDTAGTPSS